MKTSEGINELAAALAKAQASFEAAGRDHKAKVETKTGGYYEFNYADFAAYLDVCRAPLGDNGLAIIQDAVSTNEAVQVTTRLVHCSGQWIESDPIRVPMMPDSRGAITAQIVGSAYTYGRRYGLSALLGMASENDDDANLASGNSSETGKRDRPQLPTCPACNKSEGVIVGKAEYGGGLVCFAKKGGCGHTWATPEHPARNKDGSPIAPLAAEPEPPKAKSNGKANGTPSTYTKAFDALCKYRAENDTAGLKKWREGVVKNFQANHLTAEEVVKLALDNYAPRCDTMALCETGKQWALDLLEVVGSDYKPKLDQMWNLLNAKLATLKTEEPEPVGA